MAEKLIIKAFGMVAEEIGQSEIWLDSVSNTQELLAILKERYPGLEGMKFSLAVDKELVSENQKIDGAREVALLSPFSGG